MAYDEFGDYVPDTMPNTLSLEEIVLLREDRKIAAIKSIRSRTGLGLREAKEIADKAEVAMGITIEDTVPCSTCGGAGHIKSYHRKIGYAQ